MHEKKKDYKVTHKMISSLPILRYVFKGCQFLIPYSVSEIK